MKREAGARWSLLRGLPGVVCVLLFGGCASGGKPIDPNDETRSVVFGAIDMDGAPSDAEWVYLRQLDGPEADWGVSVGVVGGMFVHYGIEPGSYQIGQFGGFGGIPLLTQQEYLYEIDQAANPTSFRIERPGAHFIGAYRYQHLPGQGESMYFGLYKRDSFAVVPADTPTEEELLVKVRQRLLSTPHDRQFKHALRMVELRMRVLERKRR